MSCDYVSGDEKNDPKFIKNSHIHPQVCFCSLGGN